jgi:PRTRC genetic system protein E
MNLFQQFAPLVAAGVTIQMKLSANGEKMQLDLIPVAKENKAGITLTPKALVATAAELDAQLPTFLESYLTSQVTISGLIEQSQAELSAAEEAAKAASKPGAKPSAPLKKPRDMTAGLMTGDEDDTGDEGGTDNESVPNEEPAQAPNAGGERAANAAGGSLDESLF